MTNDRAAIGSSDHVLICDDETRLAALTAGLLEDHGFRLLTVEAGEDALKAVLEGDRPFGIMLLDVNLNSGMSAEQLLAALSERGASVRVILTSGLAEEDVPEALRRHPLVSGYLPKPYSIESLIGAVRLAARRYGAS
jgi:DNA-binding response OmpR family regulator